MLKDSALEELIKNRRQLYNATKNIYCRFLKEVVYFNNQGFFHLTHDGRDKLRSKADTKMRLNLLPHVYTVIKNATRFNRQPMLVPKNSDENKTGKEIAFYELYHLMGRNKNKRKVGIIVVLRKIGNGRLHFYSIRYASNKQNRS